MLQLLSAVVTVLLPCEADANLLSQDQEQHAVRLSRKPQTSELLRFTMPTHCLFTESRRQIIYIYVYIYTRTIMKGLCPLQLQKAATHWCMHYLQYYAASDTNIERHKLITNGAESLGLSRGLSNMNAADQSRLLIPED